ncbi:MAG: S-methyl-5-thioribose-1-phosphate isomerase [Chitinophagaceae bacterium]|nr:S-methyl-5-thioribose-1-phosphate isomerase [Oligoflexus sp.]
MYTAMSFQNDHLKLIDQKRLPHEEIWIDCRTLEDVAQSIENMTVRGAPAIATAAAYGLVLDSLHAQVANWKQYKDRFFENCKRLQATRPTAVNLFNALHAVRRIADLWTDTTPFAQVRKNILEFAIELEAADLSTCKAIGAFGAKLAEGRKLRVMTHCNTGSLATAGYGTALGVIRALHEKGLIEHVYVDETRPYLQGSRLTAFELAAEGIPYSIQIDSAAAYLMKHEHVDLVVVGADRIASNGDTANKVGTYSLAIVAKHHNVPFYVAAPRSTFDPKILHGDQIPIEMRSPREVLEHAGVLVAPARSEARNPSFDVTPNELISGLITEFGILQQPFGPAIQKLFKEGVIER